MTSRYSSSAIHSMYSSKESLRAGIDGLALVDDVVDQGGFAVVNVGDDGDVSNAVHRVARKRNSFRGAKNVQTFAEYYKSFAIFEFRFARMAELVDAHDSNSCS